MSTRKVIFSSFCNQIDEHDMLQKNRHGQLEY